MRKCNLLLNEKLSNYKLGDSTFLEASLKRLYEKPSTLPLHIQRIHRIASVVRRERESLTSQTHLENPNVIMLPYKSLYAVMSTHQSGLVCFATRKPIVEDFFLQIATATTQTSDVNRWIRQHRMHLFAYPLESLEKPLDTHDMINERAKFWNTVSSRSFERNGEILLTLPANDIKLLKTFSPYFDTSRYYETFEITLKEG